METGTELETDRERERERGSERREKQRERERERKGGDGRGNPLIRVLTTPKPLSPSRNQNHGASHSYGKENSKLNPRFSFGFGVKGLGFRV